MNAILKTAMAVAGVLIATQAAAQITFYEREGFDGRAFTTEKQIGNFERYGFNHRASSAVLVGDHWDVTYTFRGQEHRMQMTAPPGPTVTVNERGEPRA